MPAACSHLVRVTMIATLAVGVANVVAELGVYGALIVPRFGDGRVPLVWWAVMYAPVFVACVGVARAIASRREVIGASLAAGAVTWVVKLALAAAEAPGHTRALLDEGRSSVVLLARMTVGYAALFALLVVIFARVRSTTPKG